MNFSTKSNPKHFIKLLAYTAVGIGTMLFSSCSNKDVPTPETASLAVINTSPTLATFNVYIGTGKANPAPLSFGGAISYFNVAPGQQVAKFTTAGNTESIISKNISLENGKAYSLILVGKAESMELLYTTDELKAPAAEKALIRFLNLSPDAPALDLAIKDANVVVADKAYKTGSSFAEIDAKKYTFEIKEKATGIVKATLTDTDLKAGKVYTIISKGLVTPTGNDQPFGAQVIVN